METMVRRSHRLFSRILDGRAAAVATDQPVGSIESLTGTHLGRRRRHVVVVTYRRDGTPVPTVVWFGREGSRIYFRAEAISGKAKRVRREGRVRVAPSTARGKPLGPPLEGLARVVPPQEEAHAEQVIQGNFGPVRRVYERFFTLPGGVYVEVDLA